MPDNKTPDPWFLQGVRCGDTALLDGEEFGMLMRWTKEGVSVKLADNARCPAIVLNSGLDLMTDAVIVPHTLFAPGGRFTVRKTVVTGIKVKDLPG